MILRRLGNKSRIADKVISHFPAHKVYYEPFFGTGSIFFSKPKSEYSILNDLDSDVFNLFLVVKDRSLDLIDLYIITPLSEELFYYWKENRESDPVKKALRFLFLSAFGYLGKAETFRLLHSDCSYKNKVESLIRICSNEMKNTILRSKDFRLFFESIQVGEKHIDKKDRFIYADPPYIHTQNNYGTPKWTKKDFTDLLDVLSSTGIKFAISEFDHEFVITESKKRDLIITEIGERVNIKKRSTEILITNYKSTCNEEITLFDEL